MHISIVRRLSPLTLLLRQNLENPIGIAEKSKKQLNVEGKSKVQDLSESTFTYCLFSPAALAAHPVNYPLIEP